MSYDIGISSEVLAAVVARRHTWVTVFPNSNFLHELPPLALRTENATTDRFSKRLYSNRVIQAFSNLN